MKQLITLLWVLLLAVPGQSFAQTSWCHFDSLWENKGATDSLLSQKLNAYISRVNRFRQSTQWSHYVYPGGNQSQGLGSGSSCRNTVFVVPVVVHVVYDPSVPQSNLADSLIEKQIELLNKAFAHRINPSNPDGMNTGIQFCLAKKDPFGIPISGINHFPDNNPVSALLNDAQKNHLATFGYYNKENYLNIWVVPEIDAGVAGYSSAPYMQGVDGVVMKYSYFGDYTDCGTCGFDPDSRGHILAHEVGHYLGLFHPFRGGCVGTTAASCSTEGDLCCDTRPTLENHNCPVPTINQCPGLSAYGSQTDNYENLMAYASDACRDNFTPDQVSMMWSTLSNDRRNLVSVSNVNAQGLYCCLTATWFNVSNAFLCEPGTLTFGAIDHDSATYRWRIYNDTVVVLDTALSVSGFSWTLSRYGQYHVRLSIFDGHDSAVFVRTKLIELKDCGTTIPSTQGNWYFGRYAGLSFRTGGVVMDVAASKSTPRTINSTDGGISVSHNNGSLLFYAGGDSINANILQLYKLDPVLLNNHIQVVPSTLLFGHQSSSQTGIVIPFTGDSTRFYLFSTGAAEVQGGCYYSILDTDVPSLGVSGSINLPLSIPSGSIDNGSGTLLTMELITSIPACDGSHWLFVVDGSASAANQGQILVYRVSDTSVTYVGKSTHRIPAFNTFGQLKASPDGALLAAPGVVFHFDRGSGALTVLRELPINDPDARYLATSFSPDSRLLYYSISDGNKVELYQYDLESTDSLLNRQKILTEPGYFGYSLQLAPDNKIYVSKPNYDELAVIASPNEKITPSRLNACDYSDFGVSLKDADGNGGTCLQGLPNMMDARPAGETSLDFFMVDTACGKVQFVPNAACAGSYLWHFGDGDSSLLKTPFHQYGDTGTYTVRLTINGTTQKTRTIRIGEAQPQIAGDISVSCNLNDLTSYSIANYYAEHEYTWGITGGEITAMEAGESPRVRWNNAGSLYVTVRNRRNNCISRDTLHITPGTIRGNDVELITRPCVGSDSFFISGNAPEVNYPDSILYYQWEYRTSDTGAWQNTSEIFQNMGGVTGTDSTVWYRRRVYNSACESYSNAIAVKPRLFIRQNLRPTANCSTDPSLREFPMVLEFDGNEEVILEFNHYKEITPGNWGWITGSLSNYPDNFPTMVVSGDSVKIRIILSGCGSYYSLTVPVSVIMLQVAGPHEIPSCTNINVSSPLYEESVGDTVLLTVILHPSLEWLRSTANGDEFFYWEVDRSDGLGFVEIPGSNNDSLFVAADYCSQGIYRAVLLGHRPNYNIPFICTEVQACSTGRIRITEDIWAKDGLLDNGTEPNVDPNNDYWQSPDLWNCWTNYTCTVHESPEYMNVGWNYVRNIIRNEGSQASDSLTVYLYWTLGGFYEKWPLSWHFDTISNGFYNPNYGQTFPMGSEIGTVGISSIPANGTVTINHDWAPPHPSWYDTSSFYSAERVKHPLCLLSRIVNCHQNPYGMSFQEIEPTGVNVKNNNNIVTRNTEVYDSIGTNKKTPVFVLRMGNQWSVSRKVRLSLSNSISNYWDLGYITLQLSPEIFTAWSNAGAVGSGYTLSGDVFIISGDGFYLENIPLPADQWGWAYFQFRMYSGQNITSYRGTQLFNFVQYSSEDPDNIAYESDGGFNFLLNLYPGEEEDPGGPGDVGQIIQPEEGAEQKAQKGGVVLWSQPASVPEESQGIKPGQKETATGLYTVTTVKAYPNPSSGTVYFELSLESRREIGIEIFNLLGANVGSIDSKEYAAGRHTVNFDGTKLASGTYIAKVNVHGEIRIIQLVITR